MGVLLVVLVVVLVVAAALRSPWAGSAVRGSADLLVQFLLLIALIALVVYVLSETGVLTR